VSLCAMHSVFFCNELAPLDWVRTAVYRAVETDSEMITHPAYITNVLYVAVVVVTIEALE